MAYLLRVKRIPVDCSGLVPDIQVALCGYDSIAGRIDPETRKAMAMVTSTDFNQLSILDPEHVKVLGAAHNEVSSVWVRKYVRRIIFEENTMDHRKVGRPQVNHRNHVRQRWSPFLHRSFCVVDIVVRQRFTGWMLDWPPGFRTKTMICD